MRQVVELNKDPKNPHKTAKKYVQQIQEPEEVASEMLWLGSNSASFTNGEILVMDSGVGLSSADYDYWLKRQTKVELLEAQKDKI